MIEVPRIFTLNDDILKARKKERLILENITVVKPDVLDQHISLYNHRLTPYGYLFDIEIIQRSPGRIDDHGEYMYNVEIECHRLTGNIVVGAEMVNIVQNQYIFTYTNKLGIVVLSTDTNGFNPVKRERYNIRMHAVDKFIDHPEYTLVKKKGHIYGNRVEDDKIYDYNGKVHTKDEASKFEASKIFAAKGSIMTGLAIPFQLRSVVFRNGDSYISAHLNDYSALIERYEDHYNNAIAALQVFEGEENMEKMFDEKYSEVKTYDTIAELVENLDSLRGITARIYNHQCDPLMYSVGIIGESTEEGEGEGLGEEVVDYFNYHIEYQNTLVEYYLLNAMTYKQPFHFKKGIVKIPPQ